MKKALLISAMALAGFTAANAQATLELQWLNEGVAGLSESSRQGVGHNGKMYILNSLYGAGSQGWLEVWSEEGLVKKVQPEGGYFSGTNITIDDAGNIVGRAGTFPDAFTASPGAFIYNPETDALTTFDLNTSVLIGGRSDFWGHISGDVTSAEGGILLFCSNASGGKFNEIKIAEGQHVVGGQQGLKNDYWWWSPAPTYGTCGIMSVYDCLPNEAAMQCGADGYTSQPVIQLNYDKTGATWVWRKGGEYYTPEHNVTTGFALFKLGEETYIVYSRGGNNADGFAVAKARVQKDGEEAMADPGSLIVARKYAEYDEVAGAEKYSGTQNTTVHFNVEVAPDGKSAYIYHYCPRNFAAVYKFTPEEVSGISTVETAEAPVEYYNLQGVKVQNPQNGVFIKRQGNVVTKVIR